MSYLDLPCYDKVYHGINDLGKHLKRKKNMSIFLASGVTNNVLEMLQRPTKKPRFKHMIDDPTGHDLCLPLIINGEAPKLPRSLH
ncbi:hypothetical protein FOCG_15469 [Fusarium oxysporum f. sp. radicis-lycopersici 26381]|nr:hypothetical protein FOCG_15469 [Fusarium oxysporum f. sp. radicis-lycopersici 26381]